MRPTKGTASPEVLIADVDVVVDGTVDVEATLAAVEGTEDGEVAGCIVVVVWELGRPRARAGDGPFASGCPVGAGPEAFATSKVTNVARLRPEVPRLLRTRTSPRPARWGPTSTHSRVEDKSATLRAA
jgi:hypothetical protein